MTALVVAALDRLIHLARSDTGQARRAANFLLAWWAGDQWGHFPIAYLSQRGGAIYADAFGRRDAMAELVEQWRAERHAR